MNCRIDLQQRESLYRRMAVLVAQQVVDFSDPESGNTVTIDPFAILTEIDHNVRSKKEGLRFDYLAFYPTFMLHIIDNPIKYKTATENGKPIIKDSLQKYTAVISDIERAKLNNIKEGWLKKDGSPNEALMLQALKGYTNLTAFNQSRLGGNAIGGTEAHYITSESATEFDDTVAPKAAHAYTIQRGTNSKADFAAVRKDSTVPNTDILAPIESDAMQEGDTVSVMADTDSKYIANATAETLPIIITDNKKTALHYPSIAYLNGKPYLPAQGEEKVKIFSDKNSKVYTIRSHKALVAAVNGGEKLVSFEAREFEKYNKIAEDVVRNRKPFFEEWKKNKNFVAQTTVIKKSNGNLYSTDQDVNGNEGDIEHRNFKRVNDVFGEGGLIGIRVPEGYRIGLNETLSNFIVSPVNLPNVRVFLLHKGPAYRGDSIVNTLYPVPLYNARYKESDVGMTIVKRMTEELKVLKGKRSDIDNNVVERLRKLIESHFVTKNDNNVIYMNFTKVEKAEEGQSEGKFNPSLTINHSASISKDGFSRKVILMTEFYFQGNTNDIVGRIKLKVYDPETKKSIAYFDTASVGGEEQLKNYLVKNLNDKMNFSKFTEDVSKIKNEEILNSFWGNRYFNVSLQKINSKTEIDLMPELGKVDYNNFISDNKLVMTKAATITDGESVKPAFVKINIKFGNFSSTTTEKTTESSVEQTVIKDEVVPVKDNIDDVIDNLNKAANEINKTCK